MLNYQRVHVIFNFWQVIQERYGPLGPPFLQQPGPCMPCPTPWGGSFLMWSLWLATLLGRIQIRHWDQNIRSLDPEAIIPSGKHRKNYGKSQFFMGQSTISTGPFSIANCLFTRGYIVCWRHCFHVSFQVFLRFDSELGWNTPFKR